MKRKRGKRVHGDTLPAPEDLPNVKFIFYNGETIRFGAKELE